MNRHQDGSRQSNNASNGYPLCMKKMQQLQLIQLLQPIHQDQVVVVSYFRLVQKVSCMTQHSVTTYEA